jgi:hypothetical protein
MNRKIILGLLIGAVAGVIDLIPMIIQKLTWDAILAAFSLWILVGFMIATSNLQLKPVWKGIVIAILCLMPSAFIIGWHKPFSLLPIMVMTIVLGALVGFSMHKLMKVQV